MLEKDAKKEVMLYLYHKMKEEGAVFCFISDIAKSLPDSDTKQIRRIAFALKRDGYVNFTPIATDNGRFENLNSEGMEYVENHYLGETNNNKKKEEPKKTISTSRTVKFIRNYQPTETRSITKNMNEAPCFNVDKLAKCYSDLIEDVASSKDKDNVSMLGIFAPWGRGKSYFFSRVKRILPANKFDVIDFNAWKYQETPALWAYLFESFFRNKSWWFRFTYTLKRHILSLILDIILFSVPLIITYLLKGDDPLKWIVGGSSLLAFVIKAIADNANSAISLIKKYTKGFAFSSEMGVQAEVEKELEKLLRFWIPQKQIGEKAVVLYVEDIDRCKSERMVAVIDSLRTVLENEVIRKRLIVVCSIDSQRLLKAIKLHFQQILSNEDEQTQEWNAHDQLDKLFLCSISLPMLDVPEALEFIENLTGETAPSRKFYLSNNEENQTDAEIIEESSKEKDISSESEEELILTKKELTVWLADIIDTYDLAPTPREIRHIYYRCLLAMNILHALNEKISKDVVNQIIQHSYGYEMELKESDTFLNGFVVDMVVPYDYPKKKE